MQQASQKTTPLGDAKTRLNDLAKEYLAKANGNTSLAISSMAAYLLKDAALLKELIAPLVLAAAHSTVRHARHGGNQAVFDPSHGKSGVTILANGMKAALLDMRLSNGTELRNASRAEVAATADLYEKQGNTLVLKARFLKLVAQSVPDGKTVGQVVSDARATELWEEAGNND